MVPDGFGSGWREHEETHVEMQMRIFGRWVHLVNVDVDGGTDDPQPLDAGFLGRFFQGDRGKVRVAVGVPARLQPLLQLGVEQQQARIARRVDHERAAGQMARSTRANGNVVVRINEFEDARSVLVESGAVRGAKESPSHVPVLARQEVGWVIDNGEVHERGA